MIATLVVGRDCFFPPSLPLLKSRKVSRVLDVASGTGEAAAMAIPIVGDTGFVVGADISLEMVKSARVRLDAAIVLAGQR